MMDTPYILSAKGITKTFPGVHALENVDFSLKRGEVHALMGENGAGKSTLIKCLTGVEHPDAGVIEFDGKPVEVRSPMHAQEIGLTTVYQEVNLCTNISVAENVMLGHEPKGV
jgi:simple sugar transport system ATP-binding protein